MAKPGKLVNIKREHGKHELGSAMQVERQQFGYGLFDCAHSKRHTMACNGIVGEGGSKGSRCCLA